MGFDVRYALRMLFKRPLFSAMVVLTVGLGIAATTTAFSVVNAVLIEPLPYPEPDDLVYVWEHNLPRARDRNVVSPANFVAWREQADAFSAIAAFAGVSATVTGDGDPERIGLIQSTAALFPLLGATPLHGRLFAEGEDVAGAPLVAVLSEAFWRSRFGADPEVIGREITVNERALTVIGVMPASFELEVPVSFGFTGTNDVYMPIQVGEAHRTATGRFLNVVARLAPGVTLEAGQRRMGALAQRLETEFPERQTGWTVNVLPMREQIVGDVSRALLVIFGAVLFVLLIACANVANLLLTRATERQQEVAVRAALGAGRRRLARQLVVESVTLAFAGGLLGLLLAVWGVGALVALAPDLPRLSGVRLDATVLLFTFGATLFTGLLFGLAPAAYVLRSDLANWLRGRGGQGGRREARRTRDALVVTEIALSLILLVAAGLLMRSLTRLIDTGVGFETEQMLTGTIDLPGARYPEGPPSIAFFEQLVDRVQALPGVTAASAITFAPLTGPGSATDFRALDRPAPAAGENPVADIRWVHRDYHRTMGIPLVRGRLFERQDGPGAPLRVVISEALQRELWPAENPIGRRIEMEWGDTLVAEIIGVVRDIRHDGPGVTPRGMIYWNHEQFEAFNVMTLVVRAAGDPLSLVGAVRAALRAMDPTLPIYGVQTMDGLLADALKRARFAAISLGVFAALALLLALIGIYGVMSYVTQRRVQEFGVRLALGADPSAMRGLVVRQGMTLVAIALVLGAAGALGLTRLMRGLLFDIGATDPTTFFVVALLISLTALAACWLPARRASAVSPVVAMRAE